MSKYKITRKQTDLLLALKKHIELLRQYYHLAFQERNPHYYGEIAGKLRLLVYENGQRGLLTSLMKEMGVDIPIKLDVPFGKKQVTLQEYLNSLAYEIKTPHGLKHVTIIDLIKMWAQQDGSAHEDWHHDEEYVAFKESGISIGGDHVSALQLKITTGIILSVAEQFIEKLEK